MSEASLFLTIKPAAHPKPANIVRHPAWCEARTRILAAAGAGPATLALLGPAGTGKTWLLRELASDLRQRGHEVTLLRQGDLPWTLTEGAALLVDEACRMGQPALAQLAAQRSGLVILAGLPAFAETLERLAPPPAAISLPPLDPQQLRRFVAAWVERADGSGMTITDDAVQQLIIHSGGTPRLIAQLLSAALSVPGLSDQGRIGGAEIDEVAELRLGGLGSEPPDAAAAPQADPARVEPAIVPRRAKPVRVRRLALAVSALAAAIVLAWLLQAPRQQVVVEQAVVPSPATAEGVANLALGGTVANVPPASLPASPEQLRVPSAPLATGTPAAMADLAESAPKPPVPSVPLATVPPPTLATAYAAAPAIQPVPAPAPAALSDGPVLMALAASPLPLPRPQPEAARQEAQVSEAFASRPARENPVTQPTYRPGHGGPGLILIARRGDTLEMLYANIYQGLRPPPYGEVIAANPHPFRPGAMVVFPAPPGGWSTH